MAIILEAAYSKKLGLPNYSSHSYVVSIRTELSDLSQVEAESARLYALLQQSVDNEIKQVGFLPDATRYGMNNAEVLHQPSTTNGDGQRHVEPPAHHQPGDNWVGKGERVWILAKLPDSIRVVGDDITDKFLLLTNSHDGTSSLQVKFTPVRVVCQNTLTLAINNGGAGIKISHHTDIHQRLKAAEKMLGIVRHQFDELADTFREMVQVPMNSNRLEKYLQYVYPEPKDRLPTESEAECIARDRSWSEYFFDQGAGNRLRGVEGTLWAAYNGVTEWLDHRKIRQSADQRLASIWFGEANRIKARALTVAVEMLPHFRN